MKENRGRLPAFTMLFRSDRDAVDRVPLRHPFPRHPILVAAPLQRAPPVCMCLEGAVRIALPSSQGLSHAAREPTEQSADVCIDLQLLCLLLQNGFAIVRRRWFWSDHD